MVVFREEGDRVRVKEGDGGVRGIMERVKGGVCEVGGGGVEVWVGGVMGVVVSWVRSIRCRRWG